MVGKTTFEDLPSELWLNIFTYLNTRDQFHGFFDLKTRINQLLLSYYHHISLKNNDEDSRYLSEHVLPQLTHSESISSLRLENIKQVSDWELLFAKENHFNNRIHSPAL